MIKGTLRYRNTVFSKEGDLGILIVVDSAESGHVVAEALIAGEGEARKTADALGETIGTALNKIAGKDMGRRAIVWNTFIQSLMKKERGDRDDGKTEKSETIY